MFENLYKHGLRIMMAFYLSMLCIVDNLVSRRARPRGDVYILLTGTFYSKNWIDAHLYPLAQSMHCAGVKIVSTFPILEADKVQVIYPPRFLRKVLGDVPARMLTFLWVGIRHRPAFVGGFHLLLNGLAAALLGRLIRSHSIYFCVGGPAEILGGGIASGNRLFEKLKGPNAHIEKQLLNATKYFDNIVTMGTKALTFLQEHNLHSRFHVIPGGIDSERFTPTDGHPDIDLISVGRLEPVKRFDIFIKSIAEIKKNNPMVKAAIVGDGSLAIELKKLAKELSLEENILFPGALSNVEEWLRRSKIFILTSDSEGLSLAMMEAMMCGLPAVVSNVGDLGDMVEDGKNGFLITQRNPITYATVVTKLLSEPNRLQAFSRNARKSAMQFSQERTTHLWDHILKQY